MWTQIIEMNVGVVPVNVGVVPVNVGGALSYLYKHKSVGGPKQKKRMVQGLPAELLKQLQQFLAYLQRERERERENNHNFVSYCPL